MATSKNSVTGDFIQTKFGDQNAYAAGWDMIFGEKSQLSDKHIELLEDAVVIYHEVRLREGEANESTTVKTGE